MRLTTLTSQKLRRFALGEEGGTLAELAILVPFLAIMLAGVSEFGRYFQTYATLSKSTRTASRYLSNHPYTDSANLNVARNLVVCGKTACAGGDELASGITQAHVCIQYAPTGVPPETVTVSIPRTGGGCGSPYTYQPIFDLGGLLNDNNFTLALPISPSNTMYYMLNN